MFVQLRWSTFPTFVRDVGSKSTWVIVRKHTELARFQRCQGELKTSDTPAPTSLMFERNHLPEHPFLFHTYLMLSIMYASIYFGATRNAVVSHFFKDAQNLEWVKWLVLVVQVGGYTVLSRHILQFLIKVPCNQCPSDWCKETIENQKKTPTNNYLV